MEGRQGVRREWGGRQAKTLQHLYRISQYASSQSSYSYDRRMNPILKRRNSGIRLLSSSDASFSVQGAQVVTFLVL